MQNSSDQKLKDQLEETQFLAEGYRTLIDTMSEGLVVHDETGAIVQFNRAALEILGISEEQLLGRVAGDPQWITINEDGTPFRAENHPAALTLRTGKPCSNVIMGVSHPARETRWLSIKSVMIPGDMKRVLVTFSDVTQLYLAKEENAFILDSLGIGVWQIDTSNFFLKWNKYMYELYGLTPNDSSHTYANWESCLSDKSKAEIKQRWDEIYQGKTKGFDQLIEATTTHGEKKFIMGRTKVMSNSEGKPQKVYGINWDRTKEVELEHDLEQEKIKTFQSEKLATIGRLAAEVGHEINNPLAIISGKVEMMKVLLKAYQLPDTKLTEQLAKVESAVERIAAIVKSMKLFGRADDQKITTFSFSELLKETTESMRQLYGRRHISIDLELGDVKAKVKGNRMKIQQAIVNLIQNAHDAMENVEDKKISINLAVNSEFLTLTVADNGTGIDDNIRDKIFEPFFTTKDVNKGTGLGLALVKEIIDSHQGNVSFTSTIGKGTQFYVNLPLDNSFESMVHDQKSSAPLKKSKTRILIVDDEEEILNILEFKCKQISDHVEVAGSGQAALAKLMTSHFDLVLSDIKMPGMTGFQFLRELRSNSHFHQPKFLFITAGADIKAEDKSYSDQYADGILLETISTEELHKKIRELTGNLSPNS